MINMKAPISIFTILILFLLAFTVHAQAQQTIPEDRVVASQENVYYYTYKWDGERLPDGRPMVSDDLLERLENIKVEDVWQLLNELGYKNQFESGWEMIHDDVPVVGRALTAHYMPRRPDIQDRLVEEGLEAGHVGAQNSWPIDMLEEGDVYLADNFGKIEQGTMIGDKLGNSIFARTGKGVVFDGSLRDVETLANLEGFNAFARGFHPTFLDEVMLMGINVPVRIGQVTVMPGDVILAKRMGVVFIPPHLVEQVVITAEIVQLRDEFVHERVQQRVYTPGQVDARWTEEIEEDFLNWLEEGHMDRLPVPLDEMQDFLQQRTW
jgi:4-hydroxy-4-methyl-2-oxoglutarate aldolase